VGQRSGGGFQAQQRSPRVAMGPRTSRRQVLPVSMALQAFAREPADACQGIAPASRFPCCAPKRATPRVSGSGTPAPRAALKGRRGGGAAMGPKHVPRSFRAARAGCSPRRSGRRRTERTRRRSQAKRGRRPQAHPPQAPAARPAPPAAPVGMSPPPPRRPQASRAPGTHPSSLRRTACCRRSAFRRRRTDSARGRLSAPGFSPARRALMICGRPRAAPLIGWELGGAGASSS